MRLIDADELINDIQYNLWDWQYLDGITATTILKQTITDIKNEPTIDAVQVVRCEDCRYYKEDERWCRRLGFVGAFDKNNYCSRGERRTDETD